MRPRARQCELNDEVKFSATFPDAVSGNSALTPIGPFLNRDCQKQVMQEDFRIERIIYNRLYIELVSHRSCNMVVSRFSLDLPTLPSVIHISRHGETAKLTIIEMSYLVEH